MTRELKIQKRWETYLLYQRYLAAGSLPEEESKKLIDGLAEVIQSCYDNSLEPDKIYILTSQFRKKK